MVLYIVPDKCGKQLGTAVNFFFTADQSHCLMKLTKQSLVSVPRNHLIWWASWWHLLHIACKTDKVFGCSSYIDNSLKYMIIFFNTFIYCISFDYVFLSIMLTTLSIHNSQEDPIQILNLYRYYIHIYNNFKFWIFSKR